MLIDRYFKKLELNYDEVIEKLKELNCYEDNLEYPDSHLIELVYEMKLKNYIIIMKVKSMSKRWIKHCENFAMLKLEDNIYKFYNKHTGNIFIIDGSIKNK